MNFKEEQNIFWRKILKDEFVKRCQKNSSYSLRAFAQFLDIDQSLLSKVLNNQRNITSKIIEKVSLKLNIDSIFKTNELISYGFIEDHDFNLLDHWSYFAILELFKTSNFSGTAEEISKRLPLHLKESESALENLEARGFLTKEKDSYILAKENNSWVNPKTTNAKKTALQKTYLEKSIEALENVDFSKRDHSSLTLAVDSKKINLIRKKLSHLRRDFDSFIENLNIKENETTANEVYQLCLSFYPLTKSIQNKQEKNNVT